MASDPHAKFRPVVPDVSDVEAKCVHGCQCTLAWILKAVASRGQVTTMVCTRADCPTVAKLHPGNAWRASPIDDEDYDPAPRLAGSLGGRTAGFKATEDHRVAIADALTSYWEDWRQYAAETGLTYKTADKKKFNKWRKRKK